MTFPIYLFFYSDSNHHDTACFFLKHVSFPWGKCQKRSQWLKVNPDFPFWKSFPRSSPFSNKLFRNDWWCSAKLFIAWSTPTLIVYTNIWQPLTQPSSHAGKKSHLNAVLNWELRKENWREIALGNENQLTPHPGKGGVTSRVKGPEYDLCQKEAFIVVLVWAPPWDVVPVCGLTVIHSHAVCASPAVVPDCSLSGSQEWQREKFFLLHPRPLSVSFLLIPTPSPVYILKYLLPLRSFLMLTSFLLQSQHAG